MARVLVLGFLAAIGILLIAPGDASARMSPACEDDLISVFPMTIAPAAELPPPAAPVDGRYCGPGATDDPSCRPQPFVPEGPTSLVRALFHEVLVLVAAPRLAVPPHERLPFDRTASGALAPGHLPGIDRPPRSAS